MTGSRTGEGWSQYTSFADGVYYSENNTSGEKYIYSPKNLKLTKGTYTLSFDFKTDGFKKYSGTGNEGVQLFFLDGDFSPMNHHRIQYADISTNWKHYIWTFEVEEDCSGDAYIRFDNDRTSSYTNPTKLWVKDVKLEKGNKATGWSPAPEDVDSKADAIRDIANEALGDAKAAMKNLTDMSSDSILTPQEKVSVANEWACIQKEYQQNTTNATTMGMTSDTAYTTYQSKYSALSTYVSGLALSTKSNTTIVQSVFQTNFSAYYAANVAFLNALADKVAKLEVDKIEVGGRNLLRYTDQTMYFSKFTAWQSSLIDFVDGWIKVEQKANATTSGVITDKTSNISLLEKGKKYVLSFDAYIDSASSSSSLQLSYNYIMSNGGNFATNTSVSITKTPTRYNIEFTYNGTTTQNFGAMIGASKSGCPIFYVKNIKLERGNKPTDWTPAPEDVDAKVSALDYLKAALTDGSTEITGGLTMTNVLMLKNLADDVTAGMSGMTTYKDKEDKVLMWGGGTYEEAYAASNSENYYKSGITPITTLLKKDGTGKIGIFKISETQAIVKTNQGEILIDATENNGGVYIKDTNGTIKSAIINDSISKYEPPTPDEETLGSLTQSSYKTVYTNNQSDSTITVVPLLESLKTRNGYTNKVKAAFGREGIYVKVTTGQVSSSYPSGTPSIQLYIQLVRNGVAVKYFNTTMELYQSSGATCVFQTAIGKGTPLTLEQNIDANTEYSIVLRAVRSGGQYWGTTKIEWMGGIDVTNQYYPIYTPKTVIGIDGVVAAYNLDTFFKVQNTSDGQKIFAKGLSQAKGTPGSGELYVTSDFIDAFKAFVTKAKELFAAARYVGSNGEYSDNANTACDNILNELDTTSIIANS